MKPRPGFHTLMAFIVLALATLHAVGNRQPEMDTAEAGRTVVLTIPPVFTGPTRS